MGDEGYKIQFSASKRKGGREDEKSIMGNIRANSVEELETEFKDLLESESPIVVALTKSAFADYIVSKAKTHRDVAKDDDDDDDDAVPDDDDDDDDEDEAPRRRTRKSTATRSKGRRR